jgi:hypothetical protein
VFPVSYVYVISLLGAGPVAPRMPLRDRTPVRTSRFPISSLVHRILAYSEIIRRPDTLGIVTLCHVSAIALLQPIKVSDVNKVATLRGLDQFQMACNQSGSLAVFYDDGKASEEKFGAAELRNKRTHQDYGADHYAKWRPLSGATQTAKLTAGRNSFPAQFQKFEVR